ncbi:DUF1013 domain-containing protein [Futiania mangrovi]|uniref:DUF1013 domain-containing protein n=1 Tax=Futiania mangrovi TaxID=2959716 RepID=A0A9J6P9F1_9PROT|nr:cell cycle transcriptional regulator TrcR [Futiania mangrovii]MCP1334865.1 DUF1013 domain-containing protein [Futiania mangrovii]
MSTPLMPKATAVWLIDNTTLSFDQIADFCGLHVLEVQGIADGDVAQGIKGRDPVTAGELTREEIARCEADPAASLKMRARDLALPKIKQKGPRYTPVSKRQEKPDAINWLVRYHPELSDAQISKLIGTTKTTIQAIREKTHWNAANLKFIDPVSIGLCTQVELDQAVQKAQAKLAKDNPQAAEGATLMPAADSLAEDTHPDDLRADGREEEIDADSLFNLPKSE